MILNRGVAHDHQNGLFFLHSASQVDFLTEGMQAGDANLVDFFHLQGVSQVQLKAVIDAHFVTKGFEQNADLQMANGIGRHHQLEGVKILQDLVFDKALLAPFAVFIHIFLDRQLDRFSREGQGAGGQVEDRHLGVCQAVPQIKFLLEQVVHRAHDVFDHRFGGVIDPTPLTGFGVILAQEGLIEMDDGVLAFALFVILVEDAIDIRGVQHRSDVIDNDFHLV